MGIVSTLILCMEVAAMIKSRSALAQGVAWMLAYLWRLALASPECHAQLPTKDRVIILSDSVAATQWSWPQELTSNYNVQIHAQAGRTITGYEPPPKLELPQFIALNIEYRQWLNNIDLPRLTHCDMQWSWDTGLGVFSP
ncbi:MAG: hypothetical protein ACJAZ0_001622 [Halioglobus sp.]|jgi:hypothetical protein